MFKRIFFYVTIFLVTLGCIGPVSMPEEVSQGQDSFDRSALLKNYSENFIKVALNDLDTKLTALKVSASAFNLNSNTQNLNELRNDFIEAYKVWQHVAIFNVGKAEEVGKSIVTGGDATFVYYFNVYKLNTEWVEAKVEQGAYDFDNTANRGAQGFPALDYLLYGGEVVSGTIKTYKSISDQEIISKFTTNPKATKYKKYVTDVIDKMISINSIILNDWNNGYDQTFIQSSGNTVNSSLNKLVNDFIFYHEKVLRANKIGIPAGVFSKIGAKYPNEVEAYYSKNSKVLALESLAAVRNLFVKGSYKGVTSGSSFKTYLQALEKQDLVDEIIAQLDKAKQSIISLDDNFSNQVTTDNTKMTIAYDELQKVVVFFKTDMLQAFNVNVDYVDGDGD